MAFYRLWVITAMPVGYDRVDCICTPDDSEQGHGISWGLIVKQVGPIREGITFEAFQLHFNGRFGP
jgi:hypothetical protein